MLTFGRTSFQVEGDSSYRGVLSSLTIYFLGWFLVGYHNICTRSSYQSLGFLGSLVVYFPGWFLAGSSTDF